MGDLIIYGASSGIGKAIYHEADSREDSMGADRFRKIYTPDKTKVDVRDQSSIQAYAEEHCSNLEAVVYSVGINHLDWAEKLTPVAMISLYHTNVIGLLNVVQIHGKDVKYVVIGSDAAWRPMRTSAAYCASKAALSMLVKVLAREGYIINEIAPGMTAPTGMSEYIDRRVPEVRGWSPEYAAEYEAVQNVAGRRALPEEIAEVAVATLCIETEYLNGATIQVNGGRS